MEPALWSSRKVAARSTFALLRGWHWLTEWELGASVRFGASPTVRSAPHASVGQSGASS